MMGSQTTPYPLPSLKFLQLLLLLRRLAPAQQTETFRSLNPHLAVPKPFMPLAVCKTSTLHHGLPWLARRLLTLLELLNQVARVPQCLECNPRHLLLLPGV